MPARNIGVDEDAEARRARAVAKAGILADFDGHEVFRRAGWVVARALFEAFPRFARQPAQWVAAIELDARPVVHFEHEIEGARGHAYAKPRVGECFEDVALDEDEGGACANDLDRAALREPA